MTQESTSSYDYANNGLLIKRENPWRTHTINSRDDRGRILTTGTTAGGATVLSEAITWTADSRHDSYTATTSRLSGSNWTELRDYNYNDRRQLVSETYAPASGSSQTLVYQFDGGQTNGPGVRTSSSGAGMSVTVPSGGVDGFMRVVTEQSNNESASFAVTGTARGAEWVDLMLFGDQALSRDHIDHAGSQDSTGNWSASLDLSPGDYEMEVTATHLSGQTKSQTRNFSVTRSAAKTIDLDHFDGEGNATKRTVSGGNDQSLTWDALGRLIQVAQRDGNLDGIDWTARYDAFNRRVECTTTPVTNDVADVTRQFVERTWYDPLVEFLAIAVATKRGEGDWQRTWKVHGPDAVGGYGGLQGIGGVEATIDEATGETVGLVDDAYGHIIGYVEAGVFSYARARYSGYGALPGSEAPSLYDGVHLSRVLGWRGVGVDATGFYCLGVRYYEPNSGRFLSVDPLGHGESMSLYCYAGGDPINFVDPTGRGRGQGVVQVPIASYGASRGGYTAGDFAGDYFGTLWDTAQGGADLFNNLLYGSVEPFTLEGTHYSDQFNSQALGILSGAFEDAETLLHFAVGGRSIYDVGDMLGENPGQQWANLTLASLPLLKFLKTPRVRSNKSHGNSSRRPSPGSHGFFISDTELINVQRLARESNVEIRLTGSRAETIQSYNNRLTWPDDALPEWRASKRKSGFLEGTSKGDVDLEFGSNLPQSVMDELGRIFDTDQVEVYPLPGNAPTVIIRPDGSVTRTPGAWD